jgi:predicted dehydrogenase
MNEMNILVFGSGHYVSGQTVLISNTKTDKDLGVILPSLMNLRSNKKVAKIALYSRSKEKISLIKAAYKDSPMLSKYDHSFMHIPADSENISESRNLKEAIKITKYTAAIIALPDHLHVDALKFCIENSIPSLILKPAVTSLDDFYELQDIMPKDYLCLVDYHKVYDDANIIIESAIRNNEVGQVLAFSSYMSQKIAMVEVYKDVIQKQKLNINHYLGCHYIHLAGFFTSARPIKVRSTGQYGKIREKFKIDVMDTIQTAVTWKDDDGHIFDSFHHAGWNDSNQSPAMSYQEFRINTSEGVIFSNQRDRGLEFVMGESSPTTPNPYFFNPIDSFYGDMNLTGNYGYLSIKKFIDLVEIPSQEKILKLPTFAESERITAIICAADLSLANDSSVIDITYNKQYEIGTAQ